MPLAVYDTQVTTKNGDTLFFDLFLPHEHLEKVKDYAHHWLNSQGISLADIAEESFRFCHNEVGDENIHQSIEQQGYHIIAE